MSVGSAPVLTGWGRRWSLRGLMVALLVAVGCVGLSGCLGGGAAGGDPQSSVVMSPSYTAKPDEELFAAIRALPSVVESGVRYRDSFTYGTGYHGEIAVDGSVDPVRVLDQAAAILWQGRFTSVDIWVVVLVKVELVSGTRTFGRLPVTLDDYLGFDRFASNNEAEAAWSARYGPRPGTGLPPKTSPSFRPRPDAELIAEVKSVTGVTDFTVRYSEAERRYVGTLWVDPAADAEKLQDLVSQIMRRGRIGDIAIKVVQDTRVG